MPFKHEILVGIQTLLDKMNLHMNYNGISDRRIKRPYTIAEDGTKTFAAKVLKQLEKIVEGHLPELERIRSLVSEDHWKNYVLHEVVDLREQILYKDAIGRVMDEWKFVKQRKAKKKKQAKESGS